ncbi:P-loop containing nucleoside triphosphate hydrolase protein [Trichodelitschia bisporula]|uniref:P-loop containing nucleoside triphosphate hydrolase protein n=1 Tax=Trichodelitschia bisporula TaxID=703511 RepID=A0A6G1I500_9PEZI|nr:P-loop containing nucleoside triphosphate hydrolase protein [Trichodelitschia bisporula]
MTLSSARHILLILSGKGGVGKSSVTTQLALTLSAQGHAVGVLDLDLTGPNIPRFFGIEDARVTQAPGGLVPVTVHEGSTAEDGGQSRGPLYCMSLGFILATRSTAVIWRGPKKTAMVRQFLLQTLWPPLDYLLIDTPPGTSDEHISLVETLLLNMPAATGTGTGTPSIASAVLVTTPQAVSTADVRKELNFCRKTGLVVRGVVENMAGFVCPHCMECTNVFSKGGGQVMAQEFGVPFLGSVPLDPAWVRLVEEGKTPVYPKGTVVAGVDVGQEGGTAVEPEAEAQTESKDPGLLVEKYTHCSLFPLFDGIAKTVSSAMEAE